MVKRIQNDKGPDDSRLNRPDETSLFPAQRKLDPREYAWLNSKSKGFAIALAMHSHHVACHRAKAWLKLHEMVSELRGVIEADPNLKNRFKRIYQLIESEMRAEIHENLTLGRPKGVKARQKIAKEKQTNLIEAIKGLFDKPDKPGWGWKNQDIVKFLSNGSYGYADSTLMVTVKKEAAKYRKERKTEQASKFLNR